MATSTDEYQGWTNRETRAVHLWLSNDEGLYDAARSSVAYGDAKGLSIHGDDELKLSTESMLDPADCQWPEQDTMRKEIGSLWRVNWREVADAFRDED